MTSKKQFEPRELYRLRDTEVSVAAVARWAGYANRLGWWEALSASDRFWFADHYLKQKGKRIK